MSDEISQPRQNRNDSYYVIPGIGAIIIAGLCLVIVILGERFAAREIDEGYEDKIQGVWLKTDGDEIEFSAEGVVNRNNQAVGMYHFEDDRLIMIEEDATYEYKIEEFTADVLRLSYDGKTATLKRIR